MNNCKCMLILVGGMVLMATILIGSDLYERKMNSVCFDQQPLQEIK